MYAARFDQLVELRTKSASVLPYLTGTLYAAAMLDRFSLTNALLLLIALLGIDLATTALNNLADAERVYGTVIIGGTRFARKRVIRLIAGLLLVGTVAGLWLASRTGPVVLGLGAVSFLVGILYSSGPLPLQRTPLGELLSGSLMGFGIVFLAVYVQTGNDLVHVYFFNERFMLALDHRELFRVGLVSLPLAAAIANVMLANNLCDRGQDLVNERYTLPVLLGKSRSLILFHSLYLLGGLSLLLAIILRALPLRAVLLLPVWVLVMRGAVGFSRDPDKQRTFPLAVRNLVVIGLGLVLILLSRLIW